MNGWEYVNPEHAKLFKSMERVEKTVEAKGLTQFKNKDGEWDSENPTLKAIMHGLPLDHYWGERFKGWWAWPMRYSAKKHKLDMINQIRKEALV